MIGGKTVSSRVKGDPQTTKSVEVFTGSRFSQIIIADNQQMTEKQQKNATKMKMQLKFQEEHQSKNQYDVAYKHHDHMIILFKVVVDKAGTGYSKGRPLHGKEEII